MINFSGTYTDQYELVMAQVYFLSGRTKDRVEGLEQILWPDHCVQESWGADFHPDLDTRRIEAIFRKGTSPSIDSYSTFFDNAHRKSTGLSGYLREKGASDLYFCGLAADFCIYYSVKDALEEGFRCHLIVDATYPINRLDYNQKRQALKKQGVVSHGSAELMGAVDISSPNS